jgi:hypothetical protein
VFLQFRDRLLQLRHGRADVWQLDDVGLRFERERAEFREVIADALGGAEEFGKLGEDSASEGDIAGLHVDARVPRECLHNRQERARGEGGSFVGLRVDDGGSRGHGGDEKTEPAS